MRKLFETPKRAIISMTVIFAVVMVVAISGVYGAISKQLDEIKDLQYNSIEQEQVAENQTAQQSQPEVAPEVVPAEPVQEPETPVEQIADDQSEPAKKNKNKKKNQQSSGNQIVAQQTAPQQPVEQPAPQQTQSNANKKIGVKKAKSKALANAGVAKKNVVYTKAHLDYDDGIAIYDVEFYTNDYEYEYEIDAYSGKVREKNIEKNDRVYRPQNNSKPQSNNNQNSSSNNNNNNNSGSKNRISVDKAKSIALKHAGYSASKATFKKAKLDYDDGRVAYEIEFYVGNDEYNYEIDAKSGKIIDYDFEKNERYDDEWDD